MTPPGRSASSCRSPGPRAGADAVLAMLRVLDTRPGRRADPRRQQRHRAAAPPEVRGQRSPRCAADGEASAVPRAQRRRRRGRQRLDPVPRLRRDRAGRPARQLLRRADRTSASAPSPATSPGSPTRARSPPATAPPATSSASARTSTTPYRPRASSANLLVRRAAFEQVGGYTEGIWAGEDTDFTWRLQDAGWTLALQRARRRAARLPRDAAWLGKQWRGYAAGRPLALASATPTSSPTPDSTAASACCSSASGSAAGVAFRADGRSSASSARLTPPASACEFLFVQIYLGDRGADRPAHVQRGQAAADDARRSRRPAGVLAAL